MTGAGPMTGQPLIVDVKRHSLEDGPGIRSVVFFKGCPLACAFCHNPEAQDPGPEIAFYPQYCIACGLCATVCENEAVRTDLPDRIDRNNCQRCGACADVCPSQALRVIGRHYTVSELAELLMRDWTFYKHSGGGVTISGGECTLYPDYLESLLKTLKAADVHVTIETSGYFNYETFERKIRPHTDLIYMDLKLANPDAHRRYTGRDNRLILENMATLARNKYTPFLVRIPLIPDITATWQNVVDIVDELIKTQINRAELLPYNPLGNDKWGHIGKPKPGLPQRFMTREEIEELTVVFNSRLAKH